jgi:hypothetical protein
MIDYWIKDEQLFDHCVDDSKQLRSTEELYFVYYLQELKQHGFISKFEYEPFSFNLFDGKHFNVQKITKRGTTDAIVKALGVHVYTPDFEIEWTDKALGVFIWQDYKPTVFERTKPIQAFFSTWDMNTLVDVKGGSYNPKNNTSSVTFPLNQKWVWSKYERYIQKVVVSLDDKSIFAKTFTPKKVINEAVYKRDNEKRGIKQGDSKLKYDVRTITEFISGRGGA